MKKIILIISFVLALFSYVKVNAQEDSTPDFRWGNAEYYNLNIGQSIQSRGTEIKLLNLKNHLNRLKIGNDTLWLKVSRRTVPKLSDNLRIFVADNKTVKELTSDNEVHNLLTGDALICVSALNEPLINPLRYKFPVSFNNGFLWSAEEDRYMFSYIVENNTEGKSYCHSGEGIFFDLQNSRGKEKDWMVAIENSRVAAIYENSDKTVCVVLQSESQPEIYYIYDRLYNKNIDVRRDQQLIQGEIIGTAWGDEKWGFVQFSVVKSDSVPQLSNLYGNAVNIFPQVYELYYKQTLNFSKSFTKGRICFGQPDKFNENVKNLTAFEEYSGKGWLLDGWNPVDKVLSVEKGDEGNARFSKIMNFGGNDKFTNPENFYTYDINVPNGAYRLRAKLGDLLLPTWQKIEFEDINAGTFVLTAGEQKWTNERIVKVNDRKLTIKIYVDEKNNTLAGLSEIVFQQAY